MSLTLRGYSIPESSVCDPLTVRVSLSGYASIEYCTYTRLDTFVGIIVLLLTAFLTLVIVAVVAFIMWAGSARKPQIEALQAMESNDLVDVKTDRWLVFCPKKKDPEVGFILYPGARVDARAYSPAAQAIAAEGYLVVVVPMPLNLAAFAIKRASAVISAFPHILHWAMGGHSHGGAMASIFAYNNPATGKGLEL